MKKINPKITIGITTFNRISLLKESINSILVQNYSNLELIISNDYIQTPLTKKFLALSMILELKLLIRNIIWARLTI